MIKNPSRLISKWGQYLLLMRVHRPIGTLLLLWPTLIALWLNDAHRFAPHLIVVFVIGVFIMRSAGCIINDWADRGWDGLVARTKMRPLVTGAVSSREAIRLFIGLLAVAFGLICTTNLFTVKLSFFGALLAILYPFTKRFTYFPQMILGLAFGWSIPMCYGAVSQQLPMECWLLYLGALCWAMVYDTLYAMVDKEDDLKIGIKSSAIAFGKYDKIAIGCFQCMVLIIFMMIGKHATLLWPYYVGIAIAAMFFVYQQYLIKERIPTKCFQAFLNNNWVGMCLFIGVWCQGFR